MRAGFTNTDTVKKQYKLSPGDADAVAPAVKRCGGKIRRRPDGAHVVLTVTFDAGSWARSREQFAAFASSPEYADHNLNLYAI